MALEELEEKEQAFADENRLIARNLAVCMPSL